MALGGFFGAFANILSGLATSSMQRSDNEYLDELNDLRYKSVEAINTNHLLENLKSKLI